MKIIYNAHKEIMTMLDQLKKLKMDCIFGIDLACPKVDINAIKDALFDKKSFIIDLCPNHLFNSGEIYII